MPASLKLVDMPQMEAKHMCLLFLPYPMRRNLFLKDYRPDQV